VAHLQWRSPHQVSAVFLRMRRSNGSVRHRRFAYYLPGHATGSPKACSSRETVMCSPFRANQIAHALNPIRSATSGGVDQARLCGARRPSAAYR
jgi:hypothetical protein